MEEEKKQQSQEEVKEETVEKKEKPKKPKMVTQEEYDKLMDQFTKAMNTAAHHQNLSKYYQAEYDKVVKYRSQYLMEALLATIDGFELAFKFAAPTKEAENYRKGFEFVYKMMLDALQNEGLSIITPKVDDEFDGNTMQIVEVVETTEESKVNHVSEVLLNGYKMKDRLLRPSNVKVYGLKKEETKEESNAEECAKENKN